MVRDRRRKGEEKQTERLEVRLGVTQRDQFLAACKRAGDTPSDVLRAAMSSYIAKVQSAERKTLRQELTMKLIHNPLKTAAMALTSLAAFALIAAPSSADERLFKALDLDEDGVISTLDLADADRIILRVLDTDGSKTVTLDEFKLTTKFGRILTQGEISITSDSITVNEDGTRATYGEDVDVNFEGEDGDGFELRLPEGANWKSNASGLSHNSDNGGPIDIKVSVKQASIVTLDLSEEGRVKLITEHVDLEAFEPKDLGTVIVDYHADPATNEETRQPETP